MVRRAIVMICGPHHEKFAPEGTVLCTAFHNRTRCFHRLDHARTIARDRGALLLVCGDANRGADVHAYVEHARAYGVFTQACVWTGTEPLASNTLIDVRMAVTALLQAADPHTGFTLVTDDWHMPRAFLLALQESKRQCKKAGRPALDVDFDYCRMSWHPPEEMMLREQEGTKAIAAGTYGRGADSYAVGKPVLEARLRTG